MALATPLAEKKHIFSVGSDYRTYIDAGRVDGFSQVLGLGPPTALFAVADVEVIVPGEKQVAAVRRDERHFLALIGIDGRAKVLGLLPFAVQELGAIDVPFAVSLRDTGAEVDGVIRLCCCPRH